MKQSLHIKLVLAVGLILLAPMFGFTQNKSVSKDKPAPYPKVKSTGNPQYDEQQHNQAVKQWQENEKKRLAEKQKAGIAPVNVSGKQTTPVVKSTATAKPAQSALSAKKVKGQRELTFVDIPGFPKYIATGNPDLDTKNYQLAKAKWMAENPETYQKYVKEHSGKSGKQKRIPANQIH